MHLLDRENELMRLRKLSQNPEGGMAVVWGRRRIGKSRILSEWAASENGIHFIADQSSEAIQLHYFAHECSKQFPGFNKVKYPDWVTLLSKLSDEAIRAGWTGPLIIDELPYLAMSSPAIGSILQRWLDTDAKKANLVTALCGSSQRMMQGLVLSANSPLYGRATENIHLQELPVAWLLKAFKDCTSTDAVKLWAAFGGIPYYWELIRGCGLKKLDDIIDYLVLDPHGTLHDEPSRLLLEEMPSAQSAKPILDAIGMGANKLSEIAGRIGQPATALGHPLKRLLDLGLVNKINPFGELEKNSKRAIYTVSDPLCRLWFTVIAPNRGTLMHLPKNARLTLWHETSQGLFSKTWEELSRKSVARLRAYDASLFNGIQWGAAGRWWQGQVPEWDIVARSIDGKHLLCAEAKWILNEKNALRKALSAVQSKPLPAIDELQKYQIHRAVFIPPGGSLMQREDNVEIIGSAEVIGSLS